MIYANCEIYENENGEIGVLTRTDDNSAHTFLINNKNPDDVSINLDKRLIEFYLSKPNQHTYREWDEMLKNCEYDVSLFNNDFPTGHNGDETYYVDYYDDMVEGFEMTYVPKGMLIRISSENVYDAYGKYIGDHQIVRVYTKDDFVET